MTRILQASVFGLTIILLLMFLRRKVIDKRFRISVIFTFSLASANRVFIELYPASSLPPGLCVITIAVYCLGSTVDFYLVALSVALLLQVSAPILPTRFRHRVSPKIPCVEITFQLVITLGAHAQRGYGSCCLSVTLHLTSRMFVRLTNDTTYLMRQDTAPQLAILFDGTRCIPVNRARFSQTGSISR